MVKPVIRVNNCPRALQSNLLRLIFWPEILFSFCKWAYVRGYTWLGYVLLWRPNRLTLWVEIRLRWLHLPHWGNRIFFGRSPIHSQSQGAVKTEHVQIVHFLEFFAKQKLPSTLGIESGQFSGGGTFGGRPAAGPSLKVKVCMSGRGVFLHEMNTVWFPRPNHRGPWVLQMCSRYLASYLGVQSPDSENRFCSISC